MKGKVLIMWFGMFLLLAFIVVLVSMNVSLKAAKNLSISVGSEFVIEDGGKNIKDFPSLCFAENETVFLTLSENVDKVISHPVAGMKISADGGKSWSIYVKNEDFTLMQIVRMSNGDLLGMAFSTYYNADDITKVICHVWRSTDNGITWTSKQSTLQLGGNAYRYSAVDRGGFIFHRTLMLMPDGSLRATVYGKYDTDNRYRMLWISSKDEGVTWKEESTICSDETIGKNGPCEPVVARCKDGTLLCIFRVGDNEAMYQCRSKDDGATWSTPENLPGVDPSETYSVDPDLCLMSNGVLALSYGRPEVQMLFSIDGSGYSWSNHTTIYTDTSSCYTGIREIAPNRLLLVADRGANWQVPADYEIWGKYIDVDAKVVSTTLFNYCKNGMQKIVGLVP